MLATSMRPGEALAIRRQDCTLLDGRGAVRVTGTIVRTKAGGLFRQDVPKEARQGRGIFLPQFALSVFRRALENYQNNDDDLLFTTKFGTPYSVGYLGTLFRSFRSFHASELRAVGVEPEQLSPRTFRKTHATILAEHGGLELAQKALGHSDSRITSQHYIKPDEHVPAEAADIIDDLFGWAAQESRGA